MKFAASFCLLLASAPFAQPQDAAIVKQLDEVARAATVMVDGDVCRRIVTTRAMGFMFSTDPKDKFLASDNYDVNADAFIQTKKTLIRLSRLAAVPCDVNLWMPIQGHPDKIRIVIRNAHELSQFWIWGALYQDMIPSMKQVLDTRRRVTVTQKPGWVSVLAPVYDSLGDMAALVEVATQQPGASHENVK
jgi:hypothetical protein